MPSEIWGEDEASAELIAKGGLVGEFLRQAG